MTDHDKKQPCGYFDPEAGPECCEHVIEAVATRDRNIEELRGQVAALRKALKSALNRIRAWQRRDVGGKELGLAAKGLEVVLASTAWSLTERNTMIAENFRRAYGGSRLG